MELLLQLSLKHTHRCLRVRNRCPFSLSSCCYSYLCILPEVLAAARPESPDEHCCWRGCACKASLSSRPKEMPGWDMVWPLHTKTALLSDLASALGLQWCLRPCPSPRPAVAMLPPGHGLLAGGFVSPPAPGPATLAGCCRRGTCFLGSPSQLCHPSCAGSTGSGWMGVPVPSTIDVQQTSATASGGQWGFSCERKFCVSKALV